MQICCKLWDPQDPKFIAPKDLERAKNFGLLKTESLKLLIEEVDNMIANAHAQPNNQAEVRPLEIIAAGLSMMPPGAIDRANAKLSGTLTL